MIQVEFIVYRFSKLAANPAHFYEVINAGSDNALQTTELSQELAPLLGAQTTYLLQRRCLPGFRAALPVAGDRKPMSLIANLLNQ